MSTTISFADVKDTSFSMMDDGTNFTSKDVSILELESNEFEIEIGGYLVQSDARELLIKINNYRISNDLAPITWDNYYEDYLTTRAAELAIFYSHTRLNGELGSESFHGHYKKIFSYIENLLNYNSEFEKKLLDPSLTGICAGVYKSDDGTRYIAINFLSDLKGQTSFLYDDNYYMFTLKAKDGYLNCEAAFLDKKEKKYNPKSLYIGKKYNYWIYNYNENYKNKEVLFQTQYSKSSNQKVVSINKYGTIKAKKKRALLR